MPLFLLLVSPEIPHSILKYCLSLPLLPNHTQAQINLGSKVYIASFGVCEDLLVQGNQTLENLTFEYIATPEHPQHGKKSFGNRGRDLNDLSINKEPLQISSYLQNLGRSKGICPES